MRDKVAFVVDDEVLFADSVAEFLNTQGYNAIAFHNPLEALAASVPLSPDLLLSDFNMGEMDGLTLAMRLTERHPDCKVLMMSGAAQDTIPTSGMFEFLPKPVPLAVLLDRVTELIGGNITQPNRNV